MFSIDINPIAFSLGAVEIRWYGIMVVLAVIAIVAISLLEAKRLGISQEDMYNIAVWAIIAGVLMSRIVHIIDQWDYYMAHPLAIFSFEGVAVYGAVIGALLAIIIYCLVKKLSIWLVGDMVSPGALVGMAIGRVGCLLNGCCYGLTTDSACAITYSNPNTFAPLNTPVLPTQIFHIIWNMVAFAIIWVFRKRLKPKGTTLLLYLAIYAAGDLTIRFFRDGSPFLFGMQQAQVIGIVVLVVTVPWLIFRMVRYRKNTPAETEAQAEDEAK